jgi:biotin carboxylase
MKKIIDTKIHKMQNNIPLNFLKNCKYTIFIVCLCFLTENTYSQEIVSKKLRKVVIDPGHGGKDPGAIGSFSKEKEIIIEEFVKGLELSIDTFVHKGNVYFFGIADRHFALYPFLIEVGHTQPTILDEDILKNVKEEFVKAVNVLGIEMGSAKGDVKITENGVMIVEMAARISGGFLSGWTIPYTTNYYPHKDLIRLHLGEEPEFPEIKTNGHSAERVFLSIPGKLKEIISLSDENKCIKLVHMHKNVGDDLSYPYNNASRCGSVISYTKFGRDDSIMFAQRKIQYARKNVLTCQMMQSKMPGERVQMCLPIGRHPQRTVCWLWSEISCQ